MKRYSKVIVFVCIAALVTAAGVGHAQPTGWPQREGLETSGEALLERDPDVRTLISIHEEITQRIVDKSDSMAALKAAYEAGDEGQIAALLGYSDEDIRILRQRLDKARLATLDKFPEIERMVRENPQYLSGYDVSNDLGRIDRAFEYFSTHGHEDEMGLKAEPKCRIVPYIAGLVVCTGAGPVLYWLCAYAVMCSFCSGGWVSTVCG